MTYDKRQTQLNNMERQAGATVFNFSAVAEIGGSTNILSIQGKFSEEISMVGKGAGSLPTASALVADLEKISKGFSTKNRR